MKLIIIYGQEATGKLTIARSLAKKAGYKLFHNHISVDVANTLYQYGEPEYDELVIGVRLLVFESAARNDIPGLIFTWAYTHPECYGQLEAILQTVAPYNADVHMVHVHCSQAALEARVTSADRTLIGKIDSVEQLHRQQQRKHCVAVPDSGSLVLDNTAMSPDQVATRIMSEFNVDALWPDGR